jgi:L-ribulose-5-phosphate 4-epimerase
MHDTLKEKVLEANLELVRHGLVLFTWGNVSERDPGSGHIVIKPSGVPYEKMKPEDMVVLDASGKKMEGKLRPSSDAPTHIILYQHYKDVGGIVHTHSEWATSWAQAGRNLPPYGTTHADYFYGHIPCTRPLTSGEVEGAYESNTGKVILETVPEEQALNVPGVLVHGHAPFTWGKDAKEAVYHAVVLEEVAKMAFRTEVLGQHHPIGRHLLDKHFLRKHGKDAYYGQKEREK